MLKQQKRLTITLNVIPFTGFEDLEE